MYIIGCDYFYHYLLGFAFCLFETRSQYIVPAGLKLAILLPRSPKYLNYRCAQSHLSFSYYLMGTNHVYRNTIRSEGRASHLFPELTVQWVGI